MYPTDQMIDRKMMLIDFMRNSVNSLRGKINLALPQTMTLLTVLKVYQQLVIKYKTSSKITWGRDLF